MGEAALLNKRASSRCTRGRPKFRTSLAGLGAVRRPEARAGNVRQDGVVRRGYLRDGVDSLCSVRRTEEIRTRVVQDTVFLHVLGPIGSSDHKAGGPIGLNSVLVDGTVDHAQVVKDLGSLRAFARAQESRNGYRGQQRYDCDHDHDFHQREAGVFFIQFS